MKNFFIGLVAVIGILVLVVFVGSRYVLAAVLEQAIGAPVKIGRVHLGLLSSQIGIYDLEVENPEGFKEKTLARIPEIFVSYNLQSFLKNQAHISEIRLNLDEITAERNAEGRVNLMQLGAVKQSTGKAAPEKAAGVAPQQTAARGEPMQVQIDLVRLSLGRARYVNTGTEPPSVREFGLEIENAQLKNVTNPMYITVQIVMETLKRVGLDALTPDLDQFAAAFQEQAEARMEEVKEEMKARIGELTEKIKLPFGQTAATK